MSGNSEAFWLRRVPESWEIVPTRRVLHVSKEVPGPTRSSEFDRLSLTMGGVLPKNKDDDRGLQPESMDGYQLLRRNDLVFKLIDLANTATSRVGLSPSEGLVSPAYIVASPSERLLPKFAYYYFFDLYNQRVFNKLGGDGVRSAIGPKDLGAIPFPLPPLEEQRAIADYLDRETAQIDELIRKQVDLQNLLKSRQALFFSSRLSTLKTQAVRLGRIVDFLPGFAFSAEQFTESESDARLLRGVNLKPGYIDWSEVVHWPEQLMPVPHEYELAAGDLVLGMDRPFVSEGTRVAFIQHDSVGSLLVQRVLRIRPHDNIDPRYVFNMLRSSRFVDYMTPEFTGVSVPHLSETQVANFPIEIPDYDSQVELCNQVDHEIRYTSEMIESVATFVSLAQERRAALITAAVTGQIDVSQGRAA